MSYADDRGGNSIMLTFLGKRRNLHGLWDTGMIQHRLKGDSWQKWAESIQCKMNEEGVKKYQAVKEPPGWANESLGVTRRLYAELNDDKLDVAYYDRNIGTVEERLAIAGVRLAATLNGMFDTAPCTLPSSRPSE